MANAVYPLWKQSLMAEFDVNNSLDQVDGVNGVYVSIITTVGSGGYLYSTAHQFFTDIVGAQADPVQIQDNTILNGVFGGSNVTFVNVNAAQATAIVLHRQNSGSNTSWRLVLYEDTGIIGFPLSTNGGNVLLKWNVQGIFQL
jgi:hypothetical protein